MSTYFFCVCTCGYYTVKINIQSSLLLFYCIGLLTSTMDNIVNVLYYPCSHALMLVLELQKAYSCVHCTVSDLKELGSIFC